MNSNTEASPPDRAEVAFRPPLLLALSIVVGFLARWVVPLAFLSPSVSTVLGPVLTAASFGTAFWAMYTMRTSQASIPTSEPTHRIVTHGPYRFSRNPIYMTMILLHLGLGVWTNSVWFLGIAVVSFVLLSWGVISREEEYLERKFGDEYIAYKTRVRRWI